MIILIAGVALGVSSIAAGVALLFVLNGKRRWVAILPFGFGLSCIAVICILIFALQHFGAAPRDGNKEMESSNQLLHRTQ